MKALFDLVKKAKRLKVGPVAREVLSVSSLQHDIIDLNTEDQLYDKGVDANNISLGSYSFVTAYHFKPIAAKAGRDGKISNITLKDSGDFYRSFRFINSKDGFVIKANTMKEDTDLAKEFGSDILGLNNESKNIIVDWIKEPLRDAVRKRL